MPIALLAGIPSRYIPRVKKVLESSAERFEAWEFEFVASGKGPDLQLRDRKRIYEVASRRGALHVLGFSSSQNRAEVAKGIRPFFRFRWFDHALLPKLNNQDPSSFVEQLASDLAEETAWDDLVMPQSTDDALILPKDSFRCSNRHSVMWQKAESYGSTDSVPSAAKAIREFTREYRRAVELQRHYRGPQFKWQDDCRLVFDGGGAQHGSPPPPRDWKYSYRLPESFHYDVSRVDEGEFTIRDAEGKNHSRPKRGYINIDPHGFVR